MDLWSGLGTALIAAVVAFVTSRISAAIDRRAADKTADAEWSVKVLPTVRGIVGRPVAITNVGSKQATDITLEIEGGGTYELAPDNDLTRVRKGEAILFILTKTGTAVARLQWTNHRGVRGEPLRIFLDPS